MWNPKVVRFITLVILGFLFENKKKWYLDVTPLGIFLNIYLWRKVVYLFCFVCNDEMHQNWNVSNHVLGLFGKLLKSKSASAWFHGVWTCDAKILEYWMISSLKIKLNHSWKFWRNWNVPLLLLETFWWLGFNRIYLVKIGFKMWEILIFKWFLPQ